MASGIVTGITLETRTGTVGITLWDGTTEVPVLISVWDGEAETIIGSVSKV